MMPFKTEKPGGNAERVPSRHEFLAGEMSLLHQGVYERAAMHLLNNAGMLDQSVPVTEQLDKLGDIDTNTAKGAVADAIDDYVAVPDQPPEIRDELSEEKGYLMATFAAVFSIPVQSASTESSVDAQIEQVPDLQRLHESANKRVFAAALKHLLGDKYDTRQLPYEQAGKLLHVSEADVKVAIEQSIDDDAMSPEVSNTEQMTEELAAALVALQRPHFERVYGRTPDDFVKALTPLFNAQEEERHSALGGVREIGNARYEQNRLTAEKVNVALERFVTRYTNSFTYAQLKSVVLTGGETVKLRVSQILDGVVDAYIDQEVKSPVDVDRSAIAEKLSLEDADMGELAVDLITDLIASKYNQVFRPGSQTS